MRNCEFSARLWNEFSVSFHYFFLFQIKCLECAILIEHFLRKSNNFVVRTASIVISILDGPFFESNLIMEDKSIVVRQIQSKRALPPPPHENENNICDIGNQRDFSAESISTCRLNPAKTSDSVIFFKINLSENFHLVTIRVGFFQILTSILYKKAMGVGLPCRFFLRYLITW